MDFQRDMTDRIFCCKETLKEMLLYYLSIIRLIHEYNIQGKHDSEYNHYLSWKFDIERLLKYQYSISIGIHDEMMELAFGNINYDENDLISELDEILLS